MADKPQTVDEIEMPDITDDVLNEGKETAIPDTGVVVDEPVVEEKAEESEQQEEPEPPVTEEPKAADKAVEVPPAEPADEVRTRGIKERLAVKRQVTESLAKQPEFTPQTADDLAATGMEPALAGVEALRQEVRRDQIVNELTDLNASINSDANRTLREFPVFDPASDQYDKAFEKQVADLYKQYAHFEMDTSGSYITRADIPMYEFFASYGAARGAGSKRGQLDGAKAADKMASAAEDASTASVASTKTNRTKTEDELFEEGLSGKSGTYASKR